MRWLKIATLNDDSAWGYADYEQYIQTPEGRNSYMSIGHNSSNVILWTIDDNFQLQEMSPDEVNNLPLHHRHHGTMIPVDEDRITGRVDLDLMQGSISLGYDDAFFSSVENQMRIFNILVDQYPGVKFFVFNGPLFNKVPLQKYIDSINI